MEISLTDLQVLFKDTDFTIIAIRKDLKSSEQYVDVKINHQNGEIWEGSIPYYYRRTGLFIENPIDLLAYLTSIKNYFTKSHIIKFQKEEKKFWSENVTKSDVTVHFFNELIKLKWTSQFPQNDNPQRRIQDIKEKGYTISSKRDGRKGERLLLPIPRGIASGYEIFSINFRKKALKTLNQINVYELSTANKHGLLPDHKFPEIRWNETTRTENPEEMSESEIKEKFQLIDNQRNQQKREACRKCFQTGQRGKLYGINYFYTGNENWSTDYPKIGKEAERGCVGCGWYDIQKWRDSLNELILKK